MELSQSVINSTQDITWFQSWLSKVQNEFIDEEKFSLKNVSKETINDKYAQVLIDLVKNPKLVDQFLKNTSGTTLTNNIQDSSNWTVELSSLIRHGKSSSRAALLLLSYCTIVLVSLFGNLLVSYVVFRTRRLHTVTNAFLANLAVADLLMTTLNIPFNLARFLLDDWPFGNIMCSIVPYVQVTSVYVSTFTMVAIAMDRYKVIIHPLKPRLTSRQGTGIICIIWLLSTSLSLPYALYNQVEEVFTYRHLVRCQAHFPSPALEFRRWLTLATFITQYALPLLVTFIAYTSVSRRIWWRVVVGSFTQQQIVMQVQAKRRTIKMLLLVVLTFAICWLPLNMYHLAVNLSSYVGSDRHSPTIYFVCHWLAMSNVCYNPFIYCWLNDHFRAGAKACLLYVLRKLFRINLSNTLNRDVSKQMFTYSSSQYGDSNTPSSSVGKHLSNSFRQRESGQKIDRAQVHSNCVNDSSLVHIPLEILLSPNNERFDTKKSAKRKATLRKNCTNKVDRRSLVQPVATFLQNKGCTSRSIIHKVYENMKTNLCFYPYNFASPIIAGNILQCVKGYRHKKDFRCQKRILKLIDAHLVRLNVIYNLTSFYNILNRRSIKQIYNTNKLSKQNRMQKDNLYNTINKTFDHNRQRSDRFRIHLYAFKEALSVTYSKKLSDFNIINAFTPIHISKHSWEVKLIYNDLN